jgi:rubrerythrin
MLSEKDYKDYLTQIENIENTMANVYQDIINRVENKEIRDICYKLSREERVHATMVWEMMQLMTP